MAQKVWVLTRSINDYNQDGEYFETFWIKKPTVKELAAYFKGNQSTSSFIDPMAALDFLLHVESGGGRRDVEHEWYHLAQYEEGKSDGNA